MREIERVEFRFQMLDRPATQLAALVGMGKLRTNDLVREIRMRFVLFLSFIILNPFLFLI